MQESPRSSHVLNGAPGVMQEALACILELMTGTSLPYARPISRVDKTKKKKKKKKKKVAVVAGKQHTPRDTGTDLSAGVI